METDKATVEKGSEIRGGALEGGVSSIHAHFSETGAPRNLDGTLVVDESRFGRVVKVYEAMFRVLADMCNH